MTNEEAIKYLIRPFATSTRSYNEYLKQREAYELAIKVLKENSQDEEWLDNFIKNYNVSKDFQITDIRDREKLLDELRPRGKWIEEIVPVGLVGRGNGQYRCSNCQHGDVHAKTQEVPFCWYCGAKMDKKEADNDRI